MTFCSNCGSKLTQGIPELDNRLRHICPNCHTIHYENPKIVTGILPYWEDEILLCKRAIEPRKGYWTLPSGFMENNESVEEGALREAQEEANLDLTLQHLHTLYSIPHISQVYILFLGKLNSLDYKPGPETDKIERFKASKIPWNNIAFKPVTFALEKYIENPTETLTHRSTLNRS